ncbi:ATP-dependent DNA helicase RecQ-like [Montipora capricornis]|uniref:ATP-dependent DNA helicase RecQ-like n=1 Tax=Montipora capricornis TaxID=246305 RepID=UPI0035F1C16D
MIFAESEKLEGRPVSVLVICPLKSIISDQIVQLEGLCSAAEFTPESSKKIIEDPPIFIYCSAEQALEECFLSVLKDPQASFTSAWPRLSWMSHIPSKLGQERGVPLLAITGTADESTQKTIYQQLTMNKTMVKLFVSPNRKNLKFKVAKVKKDETIAQLTWLVNELKEKGPLTPQTLIFCCTVRDIATIVNWFLVKLDNAAFSPRTSRKREDCLIGIYHSLTVESYKERLTKGLKEDGVPRVVLATTALSMGVNFPHIRRVIMYGPPRSILDFHQEAGRAGRDGLPSEVTLYYHGQQAAHCEEEVKDFLRMPGCIRVAAYASLDANITPMQPAHDFCSTCALQCNCGRSECRITTSETELTEVAMKVREVSQDDKQLLHSALLELKASLLETSLTIVTSYFHLLMS